MDIFTIYAIISESAGKIYIGQTNNIKRRLFEHNDQNTRIGKYTKQNKGPWKLIYTEEHKTRSEVLRREKQLKSFQGRDQYIKHQIIMPL